MIERWRLELKGALDDDPQLWILVGALAAAVALVAVALGITVYALWFTPWWVKVAIGAAAFAGYRAVRWVRR